MRSSKSRLRVIKLKRLSKRGLRSSKSKLRARRLIKLRRRSLKSWSRIKDYKRSYRAWKRWSMIGLRSSKTRLRVLHRQSLFKSK